MNLKEILPKDIYKIYRKLRKDVKKNNRHLIRCCKNYLETEDVSTAIDMEYFADRIVDDSQDINLIEQCYDLPTNIDINSHVIDHFYQDNMQIIDILTLIAEGDTPPHLLKLEGMEDGYDLVRYNDETMEYHFVEHPEEIWTTPNHHLTDYIEIIEY